MLILLVALVNSCEQRKQTQERDIQNQNTQNLKISQNIQEIKKLENLKLTLEKDVIPYLLNYEKKLLTRLGKLVRSHLGCCVRLDEDVYFIEIDEIDKNSKRMHYHDYADTRIYLSPDTPLFTIREALKLSETYKRPVTPPIKVPEIKALFSRIKAVRTKRKKVEAYVEEIIYIVSNLKTAYAMKSSELPLLRKKAKKFIRKIEKDLKTVK